MIRAAALLSVAQLAIALVPFRRWRETLGHAGSLASESSCRRAQRLARRVDRAADTLPFASKCLPRAMALSWMLRREKIVHQLVVAIRPRDQRDGPDSLHAWVECGGMTIIGDLPGPWHELHRAGAGRQSAE